MDSKDEKRVADSGVTEVAAEGRPRIEGHSHIFLWMSEVWEGRAAAFRSGQQP